MKNLIYITFFLSLTTAFGQVSIAKETVDGSGILDFAENTNQGIILPWVQNGITPQNASLVYNTQTQKVEFYNGLTWQDLSIKAGEVDATEISSLEESGNGIVIGENTSVEGVLVLNDSTKALILPKNIMPWENIKNPEAGTITYDPNANLICIYNGLEWTFWGL